MKDTVVRLQYLTFYKMYCGRSINVSHIINMTRMDVTPGIRPGTFLNTVNNLFSENLGVSSGKFEVQKPKTERDFIASVLSAVYQHVGPNQLKRKNHNGHIRKKAPVSILLKSPQSKALHWVTVVDVVFKANKCEMVINHWGRQDLILCGTVAKWSRAVPDLVPVLDKYTMISFGK